jgi:hypothetical protein
MPDKEMPKKQFEALKLELEQTMNRVDELNKLYHGQTGQDFVRPLRLRPLDAPEKVLIDKERLEELLETDSFMDKLYAAGVDNWDGYEIAQDMED